MTAEEQVGALLRNRRSTVAVAESCTGGLLGHRLTTPAGSSDYFRGGIIAYANDVKTALLGVAEAVLAEHGAVSAPVAGEMAQGVRRALRAELGVGITGIAGPSGGTQAKPVGLVFIAVADASGCDVQRFHFPGDRSAVKIGACQAALEMLRKRF